jgi:FkbM family methyltransferase
MLKQAALTALDRILRRRGQARVYVGADSETRHVQSARFAYESAIARALEECPVDLVLDVGANEGQFARLVRRCGHRGSIISFEPVPSTARKLEAAARADASWRVMEVALSNYEGSAEMYIYAASDWNSLHRRSDADQAMFPAQLAAESRVRVCVRRLDDLMREIRPEGSAGRVFLKIDTEGADDEVIEGARQFIAEHVDILQIEASADDLWSGTDGLDDERSSPCRPTDLGFGLVSTCPASHTPGTCLARAVDCLFVRRPSTARRDVVCLNQSTIV